MLLSTPSPYNPAAAISMKTAEKVLDLMWRWPRYLLVMTSKRLAAQVAQLVCQLPTFHMV